MDNIFLIFLKIAICGFFAIFFLLGAAFFLGGIGTLLLATTAFLSVVGKIFHIQRIVIDKKETLAETIKQTVLLLILGAVLTFIGSVGLTKAYL